MDQSEDRNPEHGASDAAREAARKIKDEAAQTLEELRSDGGLKGFFQFDKLYFPFFVRILFIAACIVIALSCVLGVVAALVAMVKVSFLEGFFSLVGILIATIVTLVVVRVWVELALVVFKINEGIQDIRGMLRNKWQ